MKRELQIPVLEVTLRGLYAPDAPHLDQEAEA